MSQPDSARAIWAALFGNVAIAIVKLAASLYTGSSAMLSEAIHSFVDTGNQGLLLYGRRRAARPPDRRHPFGYGMELYFWAFVVAVLLFALGGAFSVYEGTQKIIAPEPVSSPWVNFAVLGASFLFEGISFTVAWRELKAAHPGETSVLAAVRRSKDPGIFVVLIEDSAALVGLVLAAIGLGLDLWLDAPVFDGMASIAIGLLLVAAAMVLANETRSLLTGESASSDLVAAVRAVLAADGRVETVTEVLSMHLGPSEIMLAITLDFRDDLGGGEIELAVGDLTRRIEAAYPEASRIFLRPERPGTPVVKAPEPA